MNLLKEPMDIGEIFENRVALVGDGEDLLAFVNDGLKAAGREPLGIRNLPVADKLLGAVPLKTTDWIDDGGGITITVMSSAEFRSDKKYYLVLTCTTQGLLSEWCGGIALKYKSLQVFHYARSSVTLKYTKVIVDNGRVIRLWHDFSEEYHHRTSASVFYDSFITLVSSAPWRVVTHGDIRNILLSDMLRNVGDKVSTRDIVNGLHRLGVRDVSYDEVARIISDMDNVVGDGFIWLRTG